MCKCKTAQLLCKSVTCMYADQMLEAVTAMLGIVGRNNLMIFCSINVIERYVVSIVVSILN